LILLLSLAYLAYYAIRFNIVEHKIKEGLSLREALHNELFQLNELKAWRTAFFSVIEKRDLVNNIIMISNTMKK
jgi:hypothetical protein